MKTSTLTKMRGAAHSAKVSWSGEHIILSWDDSEPLAFHLTDVARGAFSTTIVAHRDEMLSILGAAQPDVDALLSAWGEYVAHKLCRE
jgi:hypothetical protein